MAVSEPLRGISLEELIISAQQGDGSIQNFLLRSYQPFIATCVSEVCKRFIDPKKDDEFSIGLWAFNEAILSYTPERGCSFLSFAKLVVKRKVIDYIRYIKRKQPFFSLDETYDAEKMENPREISAVKRKYAQEQDWIHLQEELLEYEEKLGMYKISLAELPEHAPKHRDARDSAVYTARVLYKDHELRTYVYRKKKLPIKALLKKVKVSKKTLERNRKFILAVFVVLDGDYIYILDYLKGVGE
ncbi:RNA polymerase sigma-I factor [Virgibacillus kimchii]